MLPLFAATVASAKPLEAKTDGIENIITDDDQMWLSALSANDDFEETLTLDAWKEERLQHLLHLLSVYVATYDTIDVSRAFTTQQPSRLDAATEILEYFCVTSHAMSHGGDEPWNAMHTVPYVEHTDSAEFIGAVKQIKDLCISLWPLIGGEDAHGHEDAEVCYTVTLCHFWKLCNTI